LRLTDFAGLKSPLFRPGFLGDKWPSIDFDVELRNVRRTTPYFFAQAKSTARELRATSTTFKIAIERRDNVPVTEIDEKTRTDFLNKMAS